MILHHQSTLELPRHKQEKYVTFKGPQKTDNLTVDTATSTSNADRKGTELKIRLDKSFSRVEDKLDRLDDLISKDLHYERASLSERQIDTSNRCLKGGAKGFSKRVCWDKKHLTFRELKFERLEGDDSESQVLDMCTLPEEVMNNQKLDGDCMEAEKDQHMPEMEQTEEMAVALDSVESYEDFIDRIYLETFTSSTPKVEALDSCKAYEDWIDEKFEETFNMSSLSVDAEENVTLNEVV